MSTPLRPFLARYFEDPICESDLLTGTQTFTRVGGEEASDDDVESLGFESLGTMTKTGIGGEEPSDEDPDQLVIQLGTQTFTKVGGEEPDTDPSPTDRGGQLWQKATL